MKRRRILAFIAAIPAAAGGLFAADARATLRGSLTLTPDGKPALKTSNGELVTLSGDEDTNGVLKDKRLANADFEVHGERRGAAFIIDPIHTRAMYVHKDGKRLLVTYWCDVCAIRTYTPGICWCCREDTALDLRDPESLK